ncbi:MAG: c-type cytochrome, partial [Arenicellales bacterium]
MKSMPSLNIKPVIKVLGLASLFGLVAAVIAQPDSGRTGEDIVNSVCAVCHSTGIANAPRLWQAEDWNARMEQGKEKIIENAINGLGGMPPRGGDLTLSDDEVRAAVAYMLTSAGIGGDTEKIVNAAATTQPETAQAATENKTGTVDSQAVEITEPPAAPQTDSKTMAKVDAVNTFNRLMKPPSKRNPAPAVDGIHDPANGATEMLQPPAVAFENLPKTQSGGNYVDWVAALDGGHIAPWFSLNDANAQPVIMDLNIVREVKGSMPNVVYPHKQHTEWLDCSNCHPAIFTP